MTWKRVASERLVDLKIFALDRLELINPRTGGTRPFFVMTTVDWVNVVAITPDSQIVLVRQYRAGTDQMTLEIPGGMVDADEAPPVAAARELLEETGYAGDPPIGLGRVHPNPAMQDNTCHTLLILNAQRVADPQLDPGEDVEVLCRPLTDMDGLLADGTITHALVVAAFAHFSRYCSNESLGLAPGSL